MLNPYGSICQRLQLEVVSLATARFPPINERNHGIKTNKKPKPCRRTLE
jgi:hypothetical protein